MSQIDRVKLRRCEASRAWFVDSRGTWTHALSQPEYDVHFHYQVDIPMRDGIHLRGNIWRPKAEGQFPVILVFTPYGHSTSQPDTPMSDNIGRANYFVPRGYVFVAVSARGRYGSEGEPYLFFSKDWHKGGHDGYDVHDCIEWLGTQSWSSGAVAMTGVSYLATVQWMGAMLGSRYLKTIVPMGSADDHFHNINRAGCLLLSQAIMLMVIGERRTNEDDLWNKFVDWDRIYRHLPLRTIDEALLGKKSQLWSDFFAHPDNDDYWRLGSPGARYHAGEITAGNYPKVHVPTLNVTGWYDCDLQGTINNYLGMVAYGPEELRSTHHLIVGPWTHNWTHSRVGDLDYGVDAELDLRAVELRWFDYWLKGIDNGVLEEPPVHVFISGMNRWRADTSWPVRDAISANFYLHSGGQANSLFGNGQLSEVKPAAEPYDRFVYDPADPVPTIGGGNWTGLKPNVSGPLDRRPVERRDDVLVYTGAPLERDLHVVGQIFAHIYAASSAPDTDFVAHLVDVEPKGYATLLATGNIRARYRNSSARQELIVPGDVHEYTIDLWSIGHLFKKGHRIRLEVTSSSFPWFDPNPNTGLQKGEDISYVVAEQTIFHEGEYPSRLVLPVVPVGSTPT
ncbi:CocE/NonD family hydrolase [Mesorhizobium sp.]|uniref:CocE/NonD family hydrolase n=1 Tax=Mesorhizobium sp. TaxID=1871066 RepID=UPI0025B7BEA6|nr:CocE/NonD family hydrolase [Mesorhizobium sp.]